MKFDDLQYCMHENESSWELTDARGIYLTRVCSKCEETKTAQYRPDVLTDSNYWADEPIEED